MYRSVILHDIPIGRIAAMERWYWRDHSPEVVRRYGPWSARHDSYLPVAAPADARRFGFFNWRFTEGYWRDLPKAGPAGTLAFTPPPVWPRVAICFTPWQPTEDFRGGEQDGSGRAILRWVLLHRYPRDVAPELADRWFVERHVPELLRQPGAWRCFSYRTLHAGAGLPGTWPGDGGPPGGHALLGWDRVSEWWFETFEDWEAFVAGAALSCSAPPWAVGASYPYFAAGEDLVSTFVLERPTDEFLRDARGYR